MTKENTLGGRIEQARRAQGLTASQLAHRLGVKASTLDNWEQDRTEPRSNKLVTLAGILNVSVSWLLTENGPFGILHRGPDTASTITQKLDRAMAIQQDLAALLVDIAADLRRMQRELDEESVTEAA